MNIERFYATDEQSYYLKTVSNKSQFIRDAIDEKLGKKNVELDNEIVLLKNLKDFNPNQLQRSLLDNELIVQTLYEEIKKQNEILKIILRRATISAGFSKQLIDNASALEQKIVNQVNDEINKINI